MPPSSPFRILDFGQVQVQLQVAPITEAGFRYHLESEVARIKDNLRGPARASTRKAVVIVDSSVALLPPPHIAKLQSEWLKQHGDLLSLVTYRLAFVVPNPLVRSLVNTVMKLAPMPAPASMHPDLEQAIDWAITECEPIGGEVESELIMEGTMAVERARVAHELAVMHELAAG